MSVYSVRKTIAVRNIATDAGLVQRLADLSVILHIYKIIDCVPSFGGTSIARTDALRNSGYP